MKLTIERAALLRALGHVQSVVERRNTIPILSNVLLRAEDGQARAVRDRHGYRDGRLGRRRRRAQGGATTVPAHTLYDIVRKLREGAQIELDADRRQGPDDAALRPLDLHPGLPAARGLSADGGRATWRIISLLSAARSEAADRPHPLRDLDRGDALLPERHLSPRRQAATRCRCCARSRPTAIAWRAWRSRCPKAPAGMPGRDRAAQDRDRAAQAARRDCDQDVAVALSDTKIRFSFGETVLTSKLIDGTFPDYDRVIPSGNDSILEVECKPFAEAVDRVSTISTEKSRAVKLAIERGSLTLSATSPENGTATEEIEVRYSAAAARDRLQRPLSARHRRADRGRRRALRPGRRRLADRGARHRRSQRALRPHADAGLRPIWQ